MISTMEVAIDIGTAFTSVFVAGNGVVLREPSVVVFKGSIKEKNVLAVGSKAYAMIGKNPEDTLIVNPVAAGVIADKVSATIMLKEFFNRIIPDVFFVPRVKVILGIPLGLSLDERIMYEEVVFSACKRVKEVTLVENIILSAAGLQLPMDTAGAGLVVNIGGGTTELAAISLNGIITGCGISIGGDSMDKAIMDSILGKHNTKLGLNTVRAVKENIASLYKNDVAKERVLGMDLTTKSVGPVVVDASDLYEVLEPYYKRIGEAVESVLKFCSPEAASAFSKAGIYLVGGGAKIAGLSEYLTSNIGLKINIAEEPEYAAILGGGKLLNNKEMLKRIMNK